jgi:hypothetical protein
VGAQTTVIFFENFESYTIDSYPPAPWTNMFSGNSGTVSAAEAHSGSQSYRSESNPGWARWDYVTLTIPDEIIYHASVFLTSAGKGGAVGFGFVEPGASNTGWWTNAVHFANDGNIYFPTRTAGVATLGTWASGVWYEVHARIDYMANAANVFINGALVGQGVSTDPKTIPESVYGTPVPLDKFGVFGDNFSGGGTSIIYYDDLAVLDDPTVPTSVESTTWGQIKALYNDGAERPSR